MIKEEVILHTLKCSRAQFPSVLAAKFPHVLEKIIALWNLPGCSAYLADLLQSNGRGGGRLDRDGFPNDAWQEIYKLAELHKTSRPR